MISYSVAWPGLVWRCRDRITKLAALLSNIETAEQTAVFPSVHSAIRMAKAFSGQRQENNFFCETMFA
jgi:hypothetical protein